MRKEEFKSRSRRMTEEEKKELFRLLVEVRDDLGGIQVGAMAGKGFEGLLHDLVKNANSLECELLRELQ
jgi:hypothetical protein